MRTYIFTQRERKELLHWLRTGERTATLNVLLSRIDQNQHRLLADSKILIAAIRKFNAGY